MARVVFTPNLRRHIDCPEITVEAGTVAEALKGAFAEHQLLGTYIVDEHNRLRKHVVIFVDGEPVIDRVRLSDPIRDDSEVYVMQALSTLR